MRVHRSHEMTGRTPAWVRRSDREAHEGMPAGLPAATRKRRRFAEFLSLAVFTVWSLTLPIRLSPEIFQAMRAAAVPGAMTIGCAEASCCTSRCYLDENGAHHCVHDEGHSCTCGLSAGNNSTPQLPISETATLPSLQIGIAAPGHTGWVSESPIKPIVPYFTPLTPPPRA